jgi:voltage-gated potassium channel
VAERTARVQQRLDRPLLVAALLVIPAIIIEQSDASHGLKTAAQVLNWCIWLAFLAEIVIILRVVPDRGSGCVATRSKSRSWC